MIRPPLKTVRVESKHFPGGVLINAENFNSETDVLVGEAKPVIIKPVIVRLLAATKDEEK